MPDSNRTVIADPASLKLLAQPTWQPIAGLFMLVFACAGALAAIFLALVAINQSTEAKRTAEAVSAQIPIIDARTAGIQDFISRYDDDAAETARDRRYMMEGVWQLLQHAGTKAKPPPPPMERPPRKTIEPLPLPAPGPTPDKPWWKWW